MKGWANSNAPAKASHTKRSIQLADTPLTTKVQQPNSILSRLSLDPWQRSRTEHGAKTRPGKRQHGNISHDLLDEVLCRKLNRDTKHSLSQDILFSQPLRWLVYQIALYLCLKVYRYSDFDVLLSGLGCQHVKFQAVSRSKAHLDGTMLTIYPILAIDLREKAEPSVAEEMVCCFSSLSMTSS